MFYYKELFKSYWQRYLEFYNKGETEKEIFFKTKIFN